VAQGKILPCLPRCEGRAVQTCAAANRAACGDTWLAPGAAQCEGGAELSNAQNLMVFTILSAAEFLPVYGSLLCPIYPKPGLDSGEHSAAKLGNSGNYAGLYDTQENTSS
jgi:hypothetical protein